jgi:hypothetical protein
MPNFAALALVFPADMSSSALPCVCFHIPNNAAVRTILASLAKVEQAVLLVAIFVGEVFVAAIAMLEVAWCCFAGK